MLHAKAATNREPHDFSLVVGGPLYSTYLQTHLADTQLGRVPRRLLAFFLITWAPLCVLSAIDPRAAHATVSFFGDIDAHARLLIALPLLIIAEPIVHDRLTLVVRQFFDRGLIAAAGAHHDSVRGNRGPRNQDRRLVVLGPAKAGLYRY